jgi:hypothetical protein
VLLASCQLKEASTILFIHLQPSSDIAPTTEAHGEDRQDLLSILMQPWQAPGYHSASELMLQRSSTAPLSDGPPWTECCPLHRLMNSVHSPFNTKIIQFPIKILESCIEAPKVVTNSHLTHGFVVYLKSSPCNFKTLYLFNCNSILSDFCAKCFVATKLV